MQVESEEYHMWIVNTLSFLSLFHWAPGGHILFGSQVIKIIIFFVIVIFSYRKIFNENKKEREDKSLLEQEKESVVVTKEKWKTKVKERWGEKLKGEKSKINLSINFRFSISSDGYI